LSGALGKRPLHFFFSLDFLSDLLADLNPTVQVFSVGHHDFYGLSFADVADLAMNNHTSLGPSEPVFKVFFLVLGLVLLFKREGEKKRHRLFLVVWVHKFELVMVAEFMCVTRVLKE